MIISYNYQSVKKGRKMENELDFIKELTETTERSKSNTHQIEEVKAEIKDIRIENRALYELTSSVKLIAQDMGNIKDDISDVKNGQKELSEKVNKVTQEVENVKNKDDIEMGRNTKKVFWEVVSKILAGLAVSGITALITILATK